MARNIYFSDKVTSEQLLYEDLVIESLRIYGQDCYYIPRTIMNQDPILADDIPSKFSSAYKLEMYIENIDGFAGEGDLFQKFGIEIRDQATFIVSRRRWAQTVASYNNDIQGDLPVNGDLIYLPLTKSLFQIMHVERESPFYQLSNLNVVRLECELFEYNDEQLDTGIEAIDNIETLGYEVKLTLNPDSDSVIMTVGDTVTETFADSTTVSGEITGWNRDSSVLSVGHISTSDGNYHMFTAGGTIISTETQEGRTIVSVEEDLGDHLYQNEAFDSDVDPFLVFDANNPFGDPS